MIGRSLGNFKIIEQIGAGGMGVVYRAHDERLERDVAIKVIPPEDLADEAARKRFRKEALALSKLNHPNIASIYDFRNEDGIDFLVMELIAGVTLDRKLVKGALDQAETLRLGMQMLEGLCAAHEQGLVHRDLKPGNLRVTPDGRLKILDFGLARALHSVTAVGATDSLSSADGIVGTLPYMAPEQLRSGTTDVRSDIYSAGAVLYEMSTGKRPFESQGAQLIDGILNQAPTPPSSVNRRISPALELIIDKSMDKDPARRYQSARELLVDLQRLQSPANHVRATKPTGKLVPVIGGVLAIALVLAGYLVLQRRQKHPTAPVLRFEQLTNFTDVALWPALSPDGKILAFARRAPNGGAELSNTAQVWVKILPNGEPVQLTKDAFNKGPLAFSPDGTQIAYTVIDTGFSWDTWIIPVLGGTEQHFLKNASGLSWAPDGSLIYSEMKHGLQMGVVNSDLSRTKVREVYTPPKSSGMAHRSSLSPDARWLLVSEMDETGWLPCRIVPFDGSSPGRRVGPSGQCFLAAWAPDGAWMYFMANSGGNYHIWRQQFPDGVPEQITSGPTEEQGIAVAPDGKSIFTAMGSDESTIWVHQSSAERQMTFEGYTQLPVLSPTENKLYFLQRSGDAPSFVSGELWSIDLGTLARTKALRGFRMTHFDLSENGKQIAFTVTEPAEQSGVWLATLKGRAAPRRVSDDKEDRVLFLKNGDMLTLSWDGNDRHLYRVGQDGSRQKLHEDSLLYLVAVSPDDQWVIAVGEVETESSTVAVKAFPLGRGTAKLICGVCAPGAGSGRTNAPIASWSRNGDTFYVSYQYFPGMGPRNFTIAIPLRKGQIFPPLPNDGVTAVEDLLKIPGAIRVPERNIFPGPDSRNFAMRRSSEKKNIVRIVFQD
jgi:eukaryotic-like serine/threonine-protein kinase